MLSLLHRRRWCVHLAITGPRIAAVLDSWRRRCLDWTQQRSACLKKIGRRGRLLSTGYRHQSSGCLAPFGPDSAGLCLSLSLCIPWCYASGQSMVPARCETACRVLGLGNQREARHARCVMEAARCHCRYECGMQTLRLEAGRRLRPQTQLASRSSTRHHWDWH